MTEEETHLKRLRELEVKIAHLEEKLDSTNEKIDRLNGGLSKVLWVVGGGFIVAFVSWITGGGLSR